MTKAIYPGSFDPVTIGHVDIIERASKTFDELIVVIMVNDAKTGTFCNEERKAMLEDAVKHLPNVKVEIGSGLTVNYARKIGASIIVRGIRAISDYEYEMQLATANKSLAEEIETIFLISRPEYSFMSSSGIKEIAKFGGQFKDFVPALAYEKLKDKYNI